MKWKDETGKKEIEKDLAQIKKYCEVNIFKLSANLFFVMKDNFQFCY